MPAATVDAPPPGVGSTTVTAAPRWARRQAAAKPMAPPPTTAPRAFPPSPACTAPGPRSVSHIRCPATDPEHSFVAAPPFRGEERLPGNRSAPRKWEPDEGPAPSRRLRDGGSSAGSSAGGGGTHAGEGADRTLDRLRE